QRRRSSSGRRRSGSSGRNCLLGFGKPRRSPAEEAQARVDYSRVLQQSTENKITAKNSWEPDKSTFIENLDSMDMLQDDAEEGGGTTGKVNFQKASCTLDASVKIYSYRVDETHQSSHRVLESLHRTGGHGGNDGHGSGNEAGEGEPGKPKRSRAQHDAALRRESETLESRLENITLSNSEREFDVDPLFAKMSKTFDESGSKGMLLNNLCVANGCQVVFDSGEQLD
ncbi:unnamed protein product, partial [Phaeothamnion confervicola]